ncbi:MAG: hypothetical protein LBN24_10530 [Mediterranea sp.]|nr:hypothetical protein [Mediterranea sp.]
MKSMKYLLSLVFLVATLTACETYGDYEQEFASIHPLGGEYYVRVFDAHQQPLVMDKIKGADVYGTYMYLYNTANNDTDKLWIKLPNSSLFNLGIMGKIGCDLKTLTFSGTAGNMANDGMTERGEFTVKSGAVTLNGVTTPSGGKADGITVEYILNGQTYTIQGFRRTAWGAEDETW